MRRSIEPSSCRSSMMLPALSLFVALLTGCAQPNRTQPIEADANGSVMRRPLSYFFRTGTCPADQYELSEDKKWCLKRCPPYEHFTRPDTAGPGTCGSCPGPNMVDEEGNCHGGV
jgi:hypothetical protein